MALQLTPLSGTQDLLRNPWKALLAGLAIYWILLMLWWWASGLAMSWFIGAGTDAQTRLLQTEGGRTFYRLMLASGSLVTLGLSVWIWLIFKGESSHLMPVMGVGKRGWMLSCLIVLAILPLVGQLVLNADRFPVLEPYREVLEAEYARSTAKFHVLLQDRGLVAVINNLILICIVPPLTEELFFRRFLARSLQKIMGLHLAVWLSAILFSLMHFEWMGFLVRICLGLMLGYLYLLSGDLKTSMVAHAFYNFIVAMVVMQGDVAEKMPETVMPWWLAVASLLCTSALLFIFGRMFHQKEQELET